MATGHKASRGGLVLSLDGQQVLADGCAQRVRLFSTHHADDSLAAGCLQYHKPMFVRMCLYRGDHMRRHGDVTPQLLLVRDVRGKYGAVPR